MCTVFNKAPSAGRPAAAGRGCLAPGSPWPLPVWQGAQSGCCAGPSQDCPEASSARRPAATLPPQRDCKDPGVGQDSPLLRYTLTRSKQAIPSPQPAGGLWSPATPQSHAVVCCTCPVEQQALLAGCKSDDEKVEGTHAVLRGNNHIPTQNTC